MSTPWMSRIRISVLCLVLLSGWCCSLLATTPPIPDQAPAYVVDLAEIIPPSLEERLNKVLRELEVKTTAQMVILTLESLDGRDMESLSLEVAEKWKIGQKDKDNGLLFTVAVKDRRYRFETGYGLEGILPDSLLGSLGRQVLVPYFKKGNYGEGIAAVTGEIVRIISRNAQVSLEGTEELPRRTASGDSVLVPVLFLILFLLFILFSRKNRRRGGIGSGPIIFPGGGWGDGTSGGFGGFSGGGGGFGGGGASGDW